MGIQGISIISALTVSAPQAADWLRRGISQRSAHFGLIGRREITTDKEAHRIRDWLIGVMAPKMPG